MRILDYLTSCFFIRTMDGDFEDEIFIEDVDDFGSSIWSINEKRKFSSKEPKTTERLPVVSIIKVTSIDDAQYIVDRLTTGSNVVINLQGVDKNLRGDTLDFVNGAQYALGGEITHINEGIFLACTRETSIDTNYS